MSELQFEDYYQLLLGDAAILDRHKNGESYQAIANDLGISVSTAHARAKRWAWDITQRNLKWQREIVAQRASGKSYKDISAALGRNESFVEYLDKHWRRQLLARQRELYKKHGVEYGYA